MERQINFGRARHIVCHLCGHTWITDLDWLDCWDQGQEACPRCAVTCEAEAAPRVTIDPRDIALVDEYLPAMAWYHTSTHSDWPSQNFDPALDLDSETVQRMGGHTHVASWARRQRSKALHVGTYEAVIQNMLRRIDNQADRGIPFYLYRVYLRHDVDIRPGWIMEPTNFVGDVDLADVCPPGIDVTRYLNYHEDPGGISLALGRTALFATQQIEIPLPAQPNEWVEHAAQEIRTCPAELPESNQRPHWKKPDDPRVIKARELVGGIAEQLPANLRDQFESASHFAPNDDAVAWAQYVAGIQGLIVSPEDVLSALDMRPIRTIS